MSTLLHGLLCHVNLIPLNPVAEAIGPDGALLTRPTQAHAEAFAAKLVARGIPASVRYSRGTDIAAGCGQLRAENERATHDGGGMTRIAYFDMPAGISGDMTLAAFLHAGLSLEDLTYALGSLGLPGYTLRAEAASQQSLGGTRVVVDVAPDQPQRDWRTIRTIIEGSGLSDRAKELALRIFGALAVAEASVHGVAVDDVHFHEVGAVDSIVDIVGTAVALDLMGIERVYASPFAQGMGGRNRSTV